SCPNLSETYNNFEDEDGCPDYVDTVELFSYSLPDNDNDGVDDRWDQCLDESENYNGVLDTDGCFDVIGAESTIVPITDSDGDGYIDELDSCIFEPETWNKYNDLDGCPDSLP
ncbi:MAG: thrombospondin, partial [Nitrosopumilus sp.]|nr:thrombospondin [Nitrosopumilus sp.]